MKLVAAFGMLVAGALPRPQLCARVAAAPTGPPAVSAAPPAAANPARTAPKPEFFGYVGVYYGFDFNNPAALTRPSFIYSENLHNQIAVNLALLGARYASERVRGTFAIQTGTYPDANDVQHDSARRKSA